MKITKHMRRQLNRQTRACKENPSGESSVVNRSLKNGQNYVVAGSKYRGENPTFAPIKDEFGMVTGFNKLKAGIPFVRLDK